MSTTQARSLAIFGGKPAFSEPLHTGRPNMGDRKRLMERIDDILDRRWFTNDGPYVRAFERRVQEYCGVRECVATCNGSSALEIMTRALGMSGEVIIPAYTFVATAHALQWQEIQPVFCDVDPVTHNIDPARVEELITPRTTGILGVHLWGNPCNVEALEEVAARHGLVLAFDAAHAFGCSHKGKMVGGFGMAEAFSFHATKFFNTFEGGAVLTNDSELAEKMRLMRNFGFRSKDDVIYLGSNGKMTEVSAAMGLTSFDSIEEFIEGGRRNYLRYSERLASIPGLVVHPHDDEERCNYHYVVVEVDEASCGLSRDQLVQVLEAENVLARRYFAPGVHRMEPYRSLQPMAGLILPETERLSETVMVLPTGETLSLEVVDGVCDILARAVAQASDVRGHLEQQGQA